MLKRILMKSLARDFCTGSSSFTQRSASFVVPTEQDTALGALLQNLCQSASGVLYQQCGRWREAKAALQGTLAAGEGCPGEQVILHTEQCWPRMVGQSRQGSIRIFQLENVFPFSVIYIILKSEYIYFTGKRVMFPLTPPLCPSYLFLLAHNKWTTLWKK